MAIDSDTLKRQRAAFKVGPKPPLTPPVKKVEEDVDPEPQPKRKVVHMLSSAEEINRPRYSRVKCGLGLSKMARRSASTLTPSEVTCLNCKTALVKESDP